MQRMAKQRPSADERWISTFHSATPSATNSIPPAHLSPRTVIRRLKYVYLPGLITFYALHLLLNYFTLPSGLILNPTAIAVPTSLISSSSSAESAWPDLSWTGVSGRRKKKRRRSARLDNDYTGEIADTGEYGLTFPDYLERHFPLADPSPPHIWLTLGGGGWEEEIAGQQLFVDQLNEELLLDEPVTEIVVLCMTTECIDSCRRRRIYAYGGYVFSRPEAIQEYTWPKLQGFIDILTTGRNVFFFDADVYFKHSPYPYMDLNSADLIFTDNVAHFHVNTGWSFARSTPATILLYQKVLEMNYLSPSRDQIRTNELLGTSIARMIPEGSEADSIFVANGLRSNFVSYSEEGDERLDGIQVHVLDVNRFRNFHYEWDLHDSTQHESVFLHLTCGDDNRKSRTYIARCSNYGTDLDNYYTDPPMILTFQDLFGTIQELEIRLKIVVAAARYSQRSVLPPAQAVIRDMYSIHDEHDGGRNLQRYSYAVFPFSDIASDLGVTILEPKYIQHAIERLVAPKRVDRLKHLDIIHEISQTNDIDMRSIHSFAQLVETLLSESYTSLAVINLKNFDWKSAPWLDWSLPAPVLHIRTCYNLRQDPTCGAICKPWPEEHANSGRKENEVWPDLKDVYAREIRPSESGSNVDWL